MVKKYYTLNFKRFLSLQKAFFLCYLIENKPKYFVPYLGSISIEMKIATEYDFGLAIAKACVDKGWEDGHAGGYSEVRAQAEIAADFAEKILAIIGPA